jgi:hypothetical protein
MFLALLKIYSHLSFIIVNLLNLDLIYDRRKCCAFVSGVCSFENPDFSEYRQEYHQIYRSDQVIGNIEYVFNEKKLIWLQNNTLKLAYLSSLHETVIVDKIADLSNIITTTISFDWKSNLIYYYDTSSKQISVQNHSDPNLYPIPLIKTDGIVADLKLDPYEGLLFWAQWDESEESFSLRRAKNDGTNKRILLENLNLALNGKIEIDLLRKRILFLWSPFSILVQTDYSGEKITITKKFIDKFLFSNFFGNIIYDDISISDYKFQFGIESNGSNNHIIVRIYKELRFIKCETKATESMSLNRHYLKNSLSSISQDDSANIRISTKSNEDEYESLVCLLYYCLKK